MALPTVAECRTILGTAADGMTDEQVQTERDHLAQLANVLFDQFRAETKRDPEALRHLLDAHRNGVESDADLYTGENDANEWAIAPDDELGHETRERMNAERSQLEGER